MLLALRKRPVSMEQVDTALDRIQERLLGQRRPRGAVQQPTR